MCHNRVGVVGDVKVGEFQMESLRNRVSDDGGFFRFLCTTNNPVQQATVGIWDAKTNQILGAGLLGEKM